MKPNASWPSTDTLELFDALAGAKSAAPSRRTADTAWTRSFEYPFTNALSDVYSVVRKMTNGGGPVLVMESFYDAFGRRRAKRNAVGDGQELMYDLGHQLLVDSMWTDAAAQVTADEYIWLDGRPVMAFRSNLSATGVHLGDSVDVFDTGSGLCSRPIDDGQVNCGLFHLVSNLQGFVNVAIHDGTGLVADLMLPDADGSVNQPRMMTAGGFGTAYAQRFNLPASFSKQARFRTSWTGGIPGWAGVNSYELAGQTVLAPGGGEVGQAWSSWSPTVSGSTDVVWSTSCSGACMSAADLFEWRAWEDGAARFQSRLRFPGQYADAETDFYENWNRYYDPQTGRYLAPEPMLQTPYLSWAMSRAGHQMPAYGYAANNPIRYIDPDGLRIYANTSVSYYYDRPTRSGNPETNTAFSYWDTGCKRVGGKWKFDGTIDSDLTVDLNREADKPSLNDGRSCNISEHEEKHVQDYLDGLDDLNSVFQSEGFGSRESCDRAVRSWRQNLPSYVRFLNSRSERLRDPFRFAR